MVHTFMRMVSPPYRRKEVLRIFRRIVGPIGVQPGCLRCFCFSDLEDDNAFLFLSEWRTKVDLANHVKTHEFLELLAAMDLSVQTPVMEFKTITETAGLELLDQLSTKYQPSRIASLAEKESGN